MIVRKLAMAIACAATLTTFALPASAGADVPIEQFSLTPLATQAGGHPDLHVSFRLGAMTRADCKCDVPRDIVVNAPAGYFGIPTNAARCTSAEFAAEQCPVESQIGIAWVLAGGIAYAITPIYNMQPRNDQAGLIAIETPIIGPQPIYTSFTPRTESDYGLESKTFAISRTVNLEFVDYIFWGVPGDHSHDQLRFSDDGLHAPYKAPEKNEFQCFPNPTPQLLEGISPIRRPDGICAGEAGIAPGVLSPPELAYNGTVKPFLSQPTDCQATLESEIEVVAYDRGVTRATAPFPSVTGCDQLSFNPSQSIKPTTNAADSPSGAEFQLDVPQFLSPGVPSPSYLREATVTLPEGFTVAPNLTNGKATCSDAEARIGTREEAQCPEASKIGSIAVETPALAEILHGYVYLGESKPGDRYRMLLVFDGFGFHVKIPGSVLLDPRTGQITIHFTNLPQAPFSRFTMHIFGAERGPLATPQRCGTYEVKSVFRPWASELPDQTSRQFFTIDSGPDGSPCPGEVRPFDPGFSAGAADNTAGAHTPFSLDITRADGEQNLTGLSVSTPPGLAATLKGIPYCPESAITTVSGPLYLGAAELASPVCEASEVGTVATAVGAGTRPLYVDGKVYLAGPYRGAPLSFLVVVPAVSGPYDLGNVVVRAAVRVDPVTAAVTTVSDPVPQIVDGIPLRLRQFRLELDRPNFTLNPTNCDPLSVGGELAADEGSIADPLSRFQVANCAGMDYSPRLRFALRGGVKRRGHPTIRATFTAKQGEANTRRVTVSLPEGELLDNAHIGNVCTRVQFAADACPAASILGAAEVSTPLLDAPLRGNVYLRSSSHNLPDIVVDLKGQVDFELAGRVDTSKGGALVTSFETVPDVPVSRFVLVLTGGNKGLLQNSESLCGASKRATVRMFGQNGRVLTRRIPLNPACGKDRRGKRAHRKRSAAVNFSRKVG